MSEPMSVVEIEDVLSSIRRLVSEDLRPTHKLVSAALKMGAAKLILTPALRVVSNEPSGYVHKADDLDDPGDLQSVLQDIEAAVPVEAAEIVPMFGSVRLQEMADVRANWGGAADNPAATDANFLASAMSRINGLSSVDPSLTAPPETIEAVVAAVGAAVGPEEWEVDGGEPAPQTKAWTDIVWNSSDVPDPQTGRDIAADILVLTEPVDVATDAKAPLVDAAPDDQSLDALGKAAQAIVQDVPEPPLFAKGDPGDGPMGQDSIVFYSEVSAQPLTGADQQVSADQAHHSDNVAQDDPVTTEDSAGFLNEDLLRDIVRDMIQAELQGTLGERITHNVRKLVRAEINRALASRDYE